MQHCDGVIWERMARVADQRVSDFGDDRTKGSSPNYGKLFPEFPDSFW